MAQEEEKDKITETDAKTGMKEIAQNPTNEYGEGVYFNGKMDKGTLNPEGAGLNERMAMASHPYHEPTPEEKEAEAKARDRNMRWAKLNDAIAAMSNLYFTSKYAPNAFDPNNLATKKLRERYDKIDADRDKDREAWWNARLAGRKQDQDEAETGRGWRYKYRQAQQAAEEKAKDRARADAQFNANLAWQKEHAANQDQLARDKMAQEQQQHKENLSAKYYQINKSGSGNNGEYYAYDEDGNIHTFTKADAAEKFAWDHGTHGEYEILNTSDTDSEKFDKKGNSKESSTSTTTTKKKGWYPKNPKREDTKSSKQEEDIDKTTYKKKH